MVKTAAPSSRVGALHVFVVWMDSRRGFNQMRRLSALIVAGDRSQSRVSVIVCFGDGKVSGQLRDSPDVRHTRQGEVDGPTKWSNAASEVPCCYRSLANDCSGPVESGFGAQWRVAVYARRLSTTGALLVLLDSQLRHVLYVDFLRDHETEQAAAFNG